VKIRKKVLLFVLIMFFCSSYQDTLFAITQNLQNKNTVALYTQFQNQQLKTVFQDMGEVAKTYSVKDEQQKKYVNTELGKKIQDWAGKKGYQIKYTLYNDKPIGIYKTGKIIYISPKMFDVLNSLYTKMQTEKFMLVLNDLYIYLTENLDEYIIKNLETRVIENTYTSMISQELFKEEKTSLFSTIMENAFFPVMCINVFHFITKPRYKFLEKNNTAYRKADPEFIAQDIIDKICEHEIINNIGSADDQYIEEPREEKESESSIWKKVLSVAIASLVVASDALSPYMQRSKNSLSHMHSVEKNIDGYNVKMSQVVITKYWGFQTDYTAVKLNIRAQRTNNILYRGYFDEFTNSFHLVSQQNDNASIVPEHLQHVVNLFEGKSISKFMPSAESLIPRRNSKFHKCFNSVVGQGVETRQGMSLQKQNRKPTQSFDRVIEGLPYIFEDKNIYATKVSKILDTSLIFLVPMALSPMIGIPASLALISLSFATRTRADNSNIEDMSIVREEKAGKIVEIIKQNDDVDVEIYHPELAKNGVIILFGQIHNSNDMLTYMDRAISYSQNAILKITKHLCEAGYVCKYYNEGILNNVEVAPYNISDIVNDGAMVALKSFLGDRVKISGFEDESLYNEALRLMDDNPFSDEYYRNVQERSNNAIVYVVHEANQHTHVGFVIGLAHVSDIISKYNVLFENGKANKILVVVTPSFPGFHHCNYDYDLQRGIEFKAKFAEYFHKQEYKLAYEELLNYELSGKLLWHTYIMVYFGKILCEVMLKKSVEVIMGHINEFMNVIIESERKDRDLFNSLIHENLDYFVEDIPNLMDCMVGDVFYLRGSQLMGLGKINEAIADAKEAYRRNPDNSDAYTLLKKLQKKKQTENTTSLVKENKKHSHKDDLLRDKLTKLFRSNYELFKFNVKHSRGIKILEDKVKEQKWNIEYVRGELRNEKDKVKRTEEAHIWMEGNKIFVTDVMVEILNYCDGLFVEEKYKELIDEIINHEKIEKIVHRLKALRDKNDIEAGELLNEFIKITGISFDWNNRNNIDGHTVAMKFAQNILIKFLDSLFAFESIMHIKLNWEKHIIEKNNSYIYIHQYANYIVSLFEDINAFSMRKLFLRYKENKKFQAYLRLIEQIRQKISGKYIVDRFAMEVKIFIAKILMQEEYVNKNMAIQKIKSLFHSV
jgi:hypothetical protein